MSTRDIVQVLDASVDSIFAPKLKSLGFERLDQTRVFQRKKGDLIQLVGISAGEHYDKPIFTVDLGIFHTCQLDDLDEETGEIPTPADCYKNYRTSLSVLRKTFLTQLFKAVLPDNDSYWRWRLTSPSTKPWKLSANQLDTNHSVKAALELFDQAGLKWLEQHSDEEALKQEYMSEMKMREQLTQSMYQTDDES